MGRKSGKKRKKDENKPKRAMSSFMYFAKEKRPEIRAANPDLKITDIGKKLGEKWKELTPEERKPYEDMAREDKERYENEMKDYVPDSSEEEEPKKKKKKRKKKKYKDPNKPKRAMSSFMFFANEKRSEVKEKDPSLKITDMGKRLADMWRELPAEEKKKYEDMAAADKERYNSQMATYTPPPERQKDEDESSSSSSDEESDSSDESSSDE